MNIIIVCKPATLEIRGFRGVAVSETGEQV